MRGACLRTWSEGAELVRIAAEKQLTLACGHQERLVFEAMRLLAAPERPIRVESVREGPWTGRSAGVSVTLDLMVHDLDLAVRLMGGKPERILASARTRRARQPTRSTPDWRSAAAEAVFISSRIAPERVIIVYNPEGQPGTPAQELRDLVANSRKAKQMAQAYGALLAVGPGLRDMQSREHLYPELAKTCDIWMIQSQNCSKYRQGRRQVSMRSANYTRGCSAIDPHTCDANVAASLLCISPS